MSNLNLQSVKQTCANTFPGETDWGSWATSSFRTPQVTSDTIHPLSPSPGSAVTTLTPTLVWADLNPEVFYYEVQVSEDPDFGPNAFLYWELLHGGVTSPPRSYTISPVFPLVPDSIYHWRVRPRVQGDGVPLPWPPAFSFQTP